MPRHTQDDDERLPSDVPRELVRARDDYLTDKGFGEESESGNYRRNAERVLTGFLAYLYTDDPQPPEDFAAFDEQHYRRFARYLTTGEFGTSPVFQQSLSNKTIHTYYAIVSGWTNWLTKEGYLDTHLAARSAAREPLPSKTESTVRDQQAWTSHQRLTATRYLNHQADSRLDEVEAAVDALKILRDRAFVYVVAFTAVRGAEILRDPNDERRLGVTWGDVDIEGETLWVFPKRQTASIDDRALTPQTIPPLERLHRVLDPGSEAWPVFPSLHWQTLYETLREHDVPEDVLEGASGYGEVFALYREYDVVPVALSTDGGRSVLRSVTEAIEADSDWPSLGLDEGEYLEPHGGRRGAATALIREEGWEAAAEQLDNTVKVLKEAYSHVTASERSQRVGDALDRHDRPDRADPDVDGGVDGDGDGDDDDGGGSGRTSGGYPPLDELERGGG